MGKDESPPPDTRRRRRARAAFGALVAYLLAALACNASLTSALLDDRRLEEDLFEYAWQLQLPWRAAHGEWAGRDFEYTLGPVFQLMAYAGNGFGLRGPGETMAGYLVVFALTALAIAALLAFRVADDPWRRFVGFASLVVLSLWSEASAVRAMTSVLVVLTYGPRATGSDEDATPISRAFLCASILSVATLFSYDRGVMGVAMVAAAAGYEVVARALARRPLRPALLRLATFAAALAVVQLIVLGFAAIWGADYFAYLGGQSRLAGSYTLGMAEGGEAGALGGAVGLFLCAGLLALAVTHRKLADLTAGMWLIGTMPSLVVALVRTDTAHVWLAMMPVAAMLVLVTLRQTERGRVGVPFASGVLCALVLFGWLGNHSERLRAWGPEVFYDVAALHFGKLEPDRPYEGNITRVVAFVRDKQAREGIRCVGAYQGGDVVHAVLDIPGPTETLLRWSGELQSQVARRIEEDRCPYFVQRLFAYDFRDAAGWNVGEDFLAIARNYEPHEALGPDVWALRLRDRPAPETARPVVAEGLGERHELPVPGAMEVRLDPPIPTDHLLRVAYTLEVPWWRKYVDGVPRLYLDVGAGGGEALSHLWIPVAAVNRRTEAIVAIHAESAERRWMTGRAPRQPRHVDRMVVRLMRETDTVPDSVGITVHSVEDLTPGSAPVDDAPTACVDERDLLADVRHGRAFARATSLRHDERFGRMYLHPNPPLYAQAEVFVPTTPCATACLQGVASLDGPEGDGARFEVHVVDREVRTLVVDASLTPDAPRHEFTFPLSPWGGRSVLLRVGADPHETPDFDWLWVDQLRLVACPETSLSSVLAAGRGRAEHVEPVVEGGHVFLHPNAPDAPRAQVTVPVRPRPGQCLITDLHVRSRPGQGDGVIFTAEVLGDDGPLTLFSQRVPPGVEPRRHWASLEGWYDREVSIRLSTLPGQTQDYDWAVFLSPRLSACPSE